MSYFEQIENDMEVLERKRLELQEQNEQQELVEEDISALENAIGQLEKDESIADCLKESLENRNEEREQLQRKISENREQIERTVDKIQQKIEIQKEQNDTTLENLRTLEMRGLDMTAAKGVAEKRRQELEEMTMNLEHLKGRIS